MNWLPGLYIYQPYRMPVLLQQKNICCWHKQLSAIIVQYWPVLLGRSAVLIMRGAYTEIKWRSLRSACPLIEVVQRRLLCVSNVKPELIDSFNLCNILKTICHIVTYCYIADIAYFFQPKPRSFLKSKLVITWWWRSSPIDLPLATL